MSCYEKLRIEKWFVAAVMQESGLRIIVDRSEAGLVTLVARADAAAR